MLSLADISRGLQAGFRLALFDKQGLALLDATREGFWKSFAALLFVLPLQLAQGMLLMPDDTPGDVWVQQTLVQIVEWLAFPVVMMTVTVGIGRAHHFFRFIVAHNWAKVPPLVVFAVVQALAFAGTISQDTAFGIIAIVGLWLLAFNFFVTRHSLEIGTGHTIGIMLLDLGLTLGIALAGSPVSLTAPPAS